MSTVLCLLVVLIVSVSALTASEMRANTQIIATQASSNSETLVSTWEAKRKTTVARLVSLTNVNDFVNAVYLDVQGSASPLPYPYACWYWYCHTLSLEAADRIGEERRLVSGGFIQASVILADIWQDALTQFKSDGFRVESVRLSTRKDYDISVHTNDFVFRCPDDGELEWYGGVHCKYPAHLTLCWDEPASATPDSKPQNV